MAVEQLRSLYQQYDAGLISGDEYDNRAYEACMQEIAQMLVEGVGEYKPVDLADVKVQRAKVGHAIKMIQDGSITVTGEVIEGEGISITQKVLDHIYAHPELEFFKNFAESYKDDPERYNRFSVDIVKIFHWILEKVDIKLDSSVVPSSLPSYLAFNDGKIVPFAAPAHQESLTLSSLFEHFLSFKTNNGLSSDIRKEYRSYFSGVTHFIGDIRIDQIEKTHIKNCLTSYLKLPVRNKKPYSGKSIAELVQMDIPESDLIKPKTMTQVKKMLQGMFRFAVDHNYLTQSPVEDVKIKVEKAPNRGAFSNTQVLRMLDAANNLTGKHEWKKWIIRLAAYTGARSGELAQLRVEDVHCDEDSGFHYLMITPDAGSTKTANALRTIPLHSKLIELGFFEYLKEKQGRIFPSNVTSAAISKWFPNFKAANGIPPKNTFKEALVFHSFRHSVVTLLRSAGANDAQVQQIVGHEKTGAGITDIYTHRITVGNLRPVVELIRYS